MKQAFKIALLIFISTVSLVTSAYGFPSTHPNIIDPTIALQPHKAIYSITLKKIREDAQILNIGGEMFYGLESSCDGWISDHQFTLFYEYADNPTLKMTSHISAFESYDGSEFNFLTTRKRNGQTYEEIRGHLTNEDTGPTGISVTFTKPEKQTQTLTQGTLLPTQHTNMLLEHAEKGTQYVTLPLFDGTDTDSTRDVSAFISTTQDSLHALKGNGPLYKIDLAFFPQNSKNEQAEYEMTLYIHKSGIIPYMLIDYGKFTMAQTLKTIKTLPITTCQ